MIKIEQTEQMTQIAKRTKRVRVKVLDLHSHVFLAQSSKDPDSWYRVQLAISPEGDRLGNCSCPAGQYGQPCRHIVAAVTLLRGIQAARRQVVETPAEMPEPTGSKKEKLLTVRITDDRMKEFKTVAELRGASMSTLVHQFIVGAIREERERAPQRFERRGVERHGARSEAARPTQADLDAAPLVKTAPEGPKEGGISV